MRAGPKTLVRSGVVAWAVVAITLLASLAGTHAHEEGPDPLPRPPVEDDPGANLYWHGREIYGAETWGDAPPVDFFADLPTWYVMADLQPLARDNLKSFGFATLGAGGPVVLGTNDLSDEFEAGIRFLMGCSLSEWYRLEASYWGGYAWSDAAAVRNEDPNDVGGFGNLFSPFSGFGNPPTLGLDYNNLAFIESTSRLHAAEINLRRRMTKCASPLELSFLVGGRYMRIEESFAYHSEASVPLPLGAVNDAVTATDNEMLGVQIGMLSQWLVGRRCWIDYELKGAVMSNDVSLSTDYQNIDETGAATSFAGQDEATKTTFLLDMSLMLNYQFTRSLTFHVGYYAMWLSGVALGPDNFAANAELVRFGPVLIDGEGRVAFHGPSIGLVAAW